MAGEIKTVGQFIDLVYEMRKAQKRSARTYLSHDITVTRSLERKVDSVLAEREHKKKMMRDNNQPELFG